MGFCYFYDLAGLQLHGAGFECSEAHNALHPERPASLWGWLLGMARYLHSAHDNPPGPGAQTVCGFRIPLHLLCPGVGWRAVCPSTQFRAIPIAEHSLDRKLGHCRRPRPCTAAHQSGAWLPAKGKRGLVVYCVMVYGPQKLILFVSSFFPLGYNLLLLLNFVK